MWHYSCTNTRRITLHGRHRLINFKYINRVYYTPERLHRYGMREDSACDRCHFPVADLMHLAWTCPGIANFWDKVFRELSSIIDCELLPAPAAALLGYTKPMPKATRKLIDMGLLMAKRRVAICWMRGPLPTLKQWSHYLLYCCTQSENFSELLPPQSRLKNFWGLYTAYMLKKGEDLPNESTKEPGDSTNTPAM